MHVYSTWEIVICEEYEVGGTHKGAAEDLSLLGVLHRDNRRIVRGCYACQLADSSGMLHRVNWQIVRGCYTVTTGE